MKRQRVMLSCLKTLNSVRFVPQTDENGEPLFCAKDVCDVLGYKKPA